MSVSRREQVIKLRKTGLTYAEIGRLGLTRERVRQIAKAETRAKKKPARDDPDALLTIAELYGHRTATRVVWLGSVMKLTKYEPHGKVIVNNHSFTITREWHASHNHELFAQGKTDSNI
jgi:hypothetical protein